MNRKLRWKAAFLAAVMLTSLIVSLPTLYGDDPAIHIAREDRSAVHSATLQLIRDTLDESGVQWLGASLVDDTSIVRFPTVEAQLQARPPLAEALPDHTVALSFAPRMPPWLAALGLKPVSLGLDLRGGVSFLFEVDLDAAVRPLLDSHLTDLRERVREARVQASVHIDDDAIVVDAPDGADREAIERILRRLERDARDLLGGALGAGSGIEVAAVESPTGTAFRISLTEATISARQDAAVEQNVLTLRSRVTELGAAEPVVQRQGSNRIVVELPGMQNPAQAARLLGVSATLQFRLVETDRERSRVGSTLYYQRDGTPIRLRNEVIASGNQLVNATPGYSEGQPAVFVRLDAQGARRMLETTQRNVGRRKAVLLISQRPELVDVDGEPTFVTRTEEVVISAPVIQGVYGSSFRITGLPPHEAQDLALLLRSGSLAAPIAEVPERTRTIGPSLGQDNIARGRIAIITGLLLVALFMAGYYRLFGLVANLALLANVVLIVAILSLLPVSLTLPGIAGIVLTIGMAVDANVLIFERIREEIGAGRSPHAAVAAGYEKAFSTIADANVTTLIAALVLLAFGTGPIKGFAITLSIGIITSMFTAIVGTRTVIDVIHGGRRVEQLWIGGHKPRA